MTCTEGKKKTFNSTFNHEIKPYSAGKGTFKIFSRIFLKINEELKKYLPTGCIPGFAFTFPIFATVYEHFEVSP